MSYTSENYTGLEIAVIGMSGRFPGANDIKALWEMLKSGGEGLSFFTNEELKGAGVDEELLRHPNYVPSRGVLDKVEYFDNAFFGFSAREATLLDPQVRIFLECTYEALEDAGYNPFTYSKKIGLFAGANPNLYWSFGTYLSGMEDMGDFANKDLLSTRISYKLNLKGPSHTLFTACSTSLVAVHHACRSLLGGECDMALAGGVSIQLPQTNGYIHQEGMILSTDGHNRSFDKDASGAVFSNGAGIVLLKPLEDALQDGDHIYAVIKGSAVNNDGNRKVGFPAPSVKGQAEVIREALQVAQIEAESISYVEAHGSATAIGDPIEVEALTQAFNTDKKQLCGIGSVKSNLGHTNIASGVAGLIKGVLSLHHRVLPPSIHFNKANPAIDFEKSPFYVVRELQQWKNTEMPLRAGVSSFGVGGTNAHVILEEAPQITADKKNERPALMLLSGLTPASLQNNMRAMADFMERNEISLRDAAYTLQVGRNAFAHRAMLVCDTLMEAVSSLNDAPGIATGIVDENAGHKIVFMFSGQGSQYINMARGLYDQLPFFREEADKGFHLMQKHFGVDLRKIWSPDGNSPSEPGLIDQTQHTQPLLYIFEHALCRSIMKLGIHPDAMIGHSLGEYVAACVAGVFSFEDGLRLVTKRGQLIQSLKPGSMMGVAISESALLPLLPKNISIAAVNSSKSCVVSGTPADMAIFKISLEAEGYQCRMLRISYASHSYLMDPVLEEFRKACSSVKMQEPSIPLISNRTGRFASAAEMRSPAYWVSHLREAVRFNDGITELAAFSNAVFIEVGPGNTLATLATQALSHRNDCTVVNMVRHPKENEQDENYFLRKLGSLWLKGVNINWNEYYSGESMRRVSLPTYAFDRKPFWIDEAAFQKKTAMLKSGSVVAPSSSRLFKPSWIHQPLPQQAKDQLNDVQCVVILGENGIGNDLMKNIAGRYSLPVVSVRLGEGFAQTNDHEYLLNPSDKSGIGTFFKTIIKDTPKIHLVLSCFLQQPSGWIEIMDGSNSPAILTGFSNIIETAAAIKDLSAISMWYLTNDSSDIEWNSGSNFSNSLLYGAGRAYTTRFDHVSFKRIEIEWNAERTPARLLKRIAAELTENIADDFVFLKGNSRLVCRTDMGIRPSQPVKPQIVDGNVVLLGNINPHTLQAAEYFLERSKKLYIAGADYFPEVNAWDAWAKEQVPQEQLFRLFRSLDTDLRCESVPVSLPGAVAAVNTLPLLPASADPLANCAGQRLMEKLQQFSSALICSYFNECGVTMQKGKVYSVEALQRRLGILPAFQKFYRYFLHVLAEDGIIENKNDQISILKEIDAAGLINDMQQHIAQHYPGSLSIYELITHCVRNYRRALSGEIPAISVLFPEGSSKLLDSVSKDSTIFPGTSFHTQKVREMVLHYIGRCNGRKVRILEVGAGRGELTQILAPALKGLPVEYHFTDIGKTFVNDAGKNFGPEYPFMEFSLFDIYGDPGTQGFEPHYFDLVLALDVVHATPSLERSIGNLQRMVRPGGWMFFIENTSALRLVNLVWGLADGWWNFEDNAMRNVTPLMNGEAWRNLLADMNFHFAGTFPLYSNNVFNDHELIMVQTRPVEENKDFIQHLTIKYAEEIGQVRNGVHSLKALKEKYAGLTLMPSYPEASLREALSQIRNECGPINSIVTFFEGPDRTNLAAVHEFAEGNDVEQCVVLSSLSPYITASDDVLSAASHAAIMPMINLFNTTGNVSWLNIKLAHITKYADAQLNERLKLTDRLYAELLDQCFSLYQAGEIIVSNINPVELALAISKINETPIRETITEESAASVTTDDAEYRLCQIWNDVFGITNTGRNDNYFELGGDSLMMVAVLSRIEREFQVKVKINEFHNNITVAALAKLIAGRQQDTHLVIAKAEEKEYYSCTSAQKTMFYLQMLHPENTAYNITKVIELSEGVDEEKLVSAMNAIISKQENLRTLFKIVNGEPSQKILDQFELKADHLHLSDVSVEQAIDAFIRPFDLTETPAIRLGFIKGNGALYMVIDIHHIICDGIAIDVLKTELANIYFGDTATDLPVQYKDFAEWQQTAAFKEYLQTQKNFWMERFNTPAPKLVLPADFARNKFDTPKGDHLVETIDRNLAVNVRKLVKASNSTLFSHLLSAAYVVLSRYTGVEDIVIGTGTKGRNFQNLDYIIGNFVNTVALRSFPAKDKSYIGFQDEVKQTISEALENQDYQYDELISQLPWNQGKDDKDLFSVAVTLVTDSLVDQQQDPSRTLFKKYVEYFDRTSKFDLDINAVDKGDDITIVIEYSSLLYKPATIRSFFRHYVHVLEQVTINPAISLQDIRLDLNVAGSKSISFKSEMLKESIKENFFNLKY